MELVIFSVRKKGSEEKSRDIRIQELLTIPLVGRGVSSLCRAALALVEICGGACVFEGYTPSAFHLSSEPEALNLA